MTIKPTELIEWATDGTALKTVTDSARWLYGWMTTPTNGPTEVGEKPNLNHQNYWQNAVYKWLNYFEFGVINPVIQPNVEIDEDVLDTYLEPIQERNKNIVPTVCSNPAIVGYTGGTENNRTRSTIYCPVGNVQMPTAKASFSGGTDYMVDCESGQSRPFTQAALGDWYTEYGGAYHAGLERIYANLFTSGGNKDGIYYDSKTGDFITYSTTGVVDVAYLDAVYDPKYDRVFFMPLDQAAEANMHYISSDGTFTAYSNAMSAAGVYSIKGCYCSYDQKIYTMGENLSASGTNSIFLRIDTSASTPVVETIPTPRAVVIDDYLDIIYQPYTKRIYLVPRLYASATWHYYDLATSAWVEFSHGIAALESAPNFGNAVLSPVTGNIYFIPTDHSIDLYYMDKEGVVHFLADGFAAVEVDVVQGATYSPTEGRIYIESKGSSRPFIHEPGERVPPEIGAGTLYNR